MTTAIRTRRLPRCEACWLPVPTCICAELPRLQSRTRVVLVMHHVERNKSSNTGRLLARMLPEAVRLRIRGEKDASPPPPLPAGRRLLLFPDPTAPELSPEMAAAGPLVLIVPDGTWSQARRMARRDPDAAAATPVRLPEGPVTRYGLRRNPREGTVSTLEAVARALGILEGPALEGPLMNAFALFVERSLYVRAHGELVAEACAPRG